MLWGHTERRYYDIWVYINWKADNLEFRFTELETDIRNMERDVSRMESDEQRINTLHNYARRIHCGLILKGGFVEHEVSDLHTIQYDVLC